MIFTLTDREYNVLDAYETEDYLIGSYIGSIIKTLDINILVKSEKPAFWKEGNYIFCEDSKGYKHWFTIYDYEDGLNDNEKKLTCYSGTIDVVSEDANPINKPATPQPFSYYFNKIFYDTGIVIGKNEIADRSRSLEYTSEEATNAEMLQYVLNGFDAEGDLAVEFKGSVPTKIVLNVFKRIGSEIPQTILTDEDESLIDLERTGSISDMATCLNPTGKDGEEGQPAVTLAGKYYQELDENGEILYYSPLNDHRVYSLKAKEMFFVKIPGKQNGEFDGYINRRYKSEAATKDSLWTESLIQLKKIDHPTVTYEAKGSIYCQIGDTIQIVSHEMQPAVMISARVLEYKFNDDDSTLNEYKFGNYRDLESNIDDLSKMMAEIKKSIVFISSQTVNYAIDNQGSIPPTEWVVDQPALTLGNWLWTRTVTNLSNGDQTLAYSISYAGTDGVDGEPGDNGYTPIKGVDYFDGEPGQNGDSGQNAITGYLTNESLVLPANPSGVVSSFSGANGYFRIMDGNEQALSGITFSLVSTTGLTTTINASGYFAVTAISTDVGTATYRAVYKGATIEKIIMVVKNKQGVTGATGSPGTNGKDGDTGPQGPATGITQQATVPTGPYVGMLWRNTGASGYINGVTYRWNGSKWEIFLMSVENLSVTNLAAISSTLGNVINPFSGVQSEGAILDGNTTIANGAVEIAGTVRGTSQKFSTSINPISLYGYITGNDGTTINTEYLLSSSGLRLYNKGIGVGNITAEQLIAVQYKPIPLASGYGSAEGNIPYYRVIKQLDGTYKCEIVGQVGKNPTGMLYPSSRYVVGNLPLNARPIRNEFFQVAADRAGGRLAILADTGALQLSPAEETTYLGLTCSFVCRGPM